MPTYRVRGDNTELPCGAKVYVIPVTDIQPGQLAMYEISCEDAKVEIVGRRDGNRINQPKRVIECEGPVSIRVVGVVVPVEDNPKEITNLNTTEYIAALLNCRRPND